MTMCKFRTISSSTFYHIGCAVRLHSITNSGLIPGGQILSRERQTVFFTAVNPMDKQLKDPYKIDLEAPRLAWYHQKKWKKHQTRCIGSTSNLLNRKGLKFYQTRCNVFILCDTLPAYCISKVVVRESGEIIYEKEYVSPRPSPTISFKDNWMKELDSEVAGSSKDTQRTQPKLKKKQLSRTVRPVGEQPFTQEIEKDVLFGREGTKHSTRTGRPVDGPKSIQSCVSMPVELVDKYEDKDEDVDADQTRTGGPVGGQQSTQDTDKFVIDDNDMDSNTATEPNFSPRSRSFLNRVKDRLRKILDQSSKDAMQDIDKHSLNEECLCLQHWTHLYSWEK